MPQRSSGLRLESVLFPPSFLTLPTHTGQPWVVSIAVLFGLSLNLGSLLELDWLAREPPAPVSPHLVVVLRFGHAWLFPGCCGSELSSVSDLDAVVTKSFPTSCLLPHPPGPLPVRMARPLRV